jgi:HD-like signal output (HDOD) protein/ActR/RegA family two-component response regulator
VTTAAPTRVLFVDDEPLVLRSIDRALRSRKVPWEARFVESGAAALALLASEPFDVVIADLRIPDLDGVEILTEVQRSYPRIARLVLSGQVGTDDCLRAMRVAHQCMAKPCNVDALRHIILRLVERKHLLDDSDLATAAARLSCLPSPPSIHLEVAAAIARGAGLAEIGRIIDGDVAITAKLIQIVNSAFFTQGNRVSTVQRALGVLGTDVVRGLLLAVEVFRRFEDRADAAAIEALLQHSKRVAQLARTLAPRELAGDAYVAGMLHDIGDLVLASLDREPQHIGDHARAGGFLLGLWGIEEPIVDAITHHHDPGAIPDERARLVDLVHVAEIVGGELDAGAAAEVVSSAWLARNPPSALDHARAVGKEIWQS